MAGEISGQGPIKNTGVDKVSTSPITPPVAKEAPKADKKGKPVVAFSKNEQAALQGFGLSENAQRLLGEAAFGKKTDGPSFTA